MAGWKGRERRRMKRIRIDPSTSGISVVGARVVDASGYGMRIESPMRLELETVVPIRLVIRGYKVDVQARVASCSQLQGPYRRFGVGLEFTGIDSNTRARLEEALREVERAERQLAAKARVRMGAGGSGTGGAA
jgi:hypothetical protein